MHSAPQRHVHESVRTYAEPAHCPKLLPCIAATMVPTKLEDELVLTDPKLPIPDDVSSAEAAYDAAVAATFHSSRHDSQQCL
jgi:hypothetical protein